MRLKLTHFSVCKPYKALLTTFKARRRPTDRATDYGSRAS